MDDFIPHDWENLVSIVDRNDLGALKRCPSEDARYAAWSTETKAQYGSVLNYLCQVRLHWPPPDPSIPVRSAAGGDGSASSSITADSSPVAPYANPIPFADPSDYKILRNDWPYGLAEGITHILVWLRTPVAVQGEGGDLTDESRALIEGFVRKTFVERLAREGGRFEDARAHPKKYVLWFKNWTALQSVHAVEHVHVLVRNVPNEIVREWTGE